jgi:CubicO group peptidase (beta-lactamase class C family)
MRSVPSGGNATPSPGWCQTKTMTGLRALILADRGELDLSAPVAAYWPEFAVAGKEGVLVLHVLSHTARLPDLSGLNAVEELDDGETVTAHLAAQPPEWQPGTAAGHHSLTFGFLVGEIVRRITRHTAGRGLPHRAPRRARPPHSPAHPAASTDRGVRSQRAARIGSRTQENAGPRSGSRTRTPWPGAVRRSRRRAGSLHDGFRQIRQHRRLGRGGEWWGQPAVRPAVAGSRDQPVAQGRSVDSGGVGTAHDCPSASMRRRFRSVARHNRATVGDAGGAWWLVSVGALGVAAGLGAVAADGHFAPAPPTRWVEE